MKRWVAKVTEPFVIATFGGARLGVPFDAFHRAQGVGAASDGVSDDLHFHRHGSMPQFGDGGIFCVDLVRDVAKPILCPGHLPENEEGENEE